MSTVKMVFGHWEACRGKVVEQRDESTCPGMLTLNCDIRRKKRFPIFKSLSSKPVCITALCSSTKLSAPEAKTSNAALETAYLNVTY